MVISTLSFFIASIWFFSLFFFINLASCLSILLIFSKNQLLDLWIFLKGFLCFYLLQFCSGLSYLLSSTSFWFFFDLALLFLSILMIGCQFRSFLSSLVGIYCYKFPFLLCFKGVPEILVSCIFILLGFKEHLYFCLHFIVYPVNIQKQVAQFPSGCVGLRVFLDPEF